MWNTVPSTLLNKMNKSNETLDKDLMNYVMLALGFIQEYPSGPRSPTFQSNRKSISYLESEEVKKRRIEC